MSNINKILICVVIFIVFILFYAIQNPLDISSEPKIFTIESGESAKIISNNLESEQIIKSSDVFLLYLFITNNYKNIQAGEYLLSPQTNVIDITKIITKGEINKKTITIIEGWNINDIANYFEQKGISTKEELYTVTGYPGEIKDSNNNLSLEGYIFPDTYNIKNSDTSKTIISKALLNWEKKMTDKLRKEIEIQNKTISEIITMASIIEKEAKTLEDKKNVSSVFWKRIETGIALQSCPTVLYSLGETKTQISTKDTEIDSPYNTYKYKGLPLGPISNPGIDSIIAAIYPNKTNYWYFLSDIEGNLHFSKTLEEHNQNKYIYLK